MISITLITNFIQKTERLPPLRFLYGVEDKMKKMKTAHSLSIRIHERYFRRNTLTVSEL